MGPLLINEVKKDISVVAGLKEESYFPIASSFSFPIGDKSPIFGVENNDAAGREIRIGLRSKELRDIESAQWEVDPNYPNTLMVSRKLLKELGGKIEAEVFVITVQGLVSGKGELDAKCD
ncbi:hypothetical protein [Xanthovirga aplysinae]|uniref:hypothetical protein n=1 Tax=Xanthovirga aplysinae TaxID=2529853 RepID=UPI0012BD0BD0|nr:hypothetical protein [Xanthovirga aplysinae]MTI31375.1 hypothetical protein [Xanthovirga aplysinae]